MTQRVFVVHGRDAALTRRFRDLLTVAGLKPLEWQELVDASGSTSPYLGQIVAYPERTVIAEIGQMRPIAGLAGLNTIRFDGSAMAIKGVLDRLKQAGCAVDQSGSDWLDPGRFAGLPVYQRGPGTHDGHR